MASNSGRRLAAIGGDGARERALITSGLFAVWSGSRCPASHWVRDEQSQNHACPAAGAPGVRWRRSGVGQGGHWLNPEPAWLTPCDLLASRISATQRLTVEQ